MEIFARWLVVGCGIYLGGGLLFALVFVSRGAQRIDPRAVGGTWGLRLAILPGTVLLWPLFVRRWRRGSPPPAEHNRHRDGAAGSEGGR
jgi:hypothetical protein